MRRAFVLSQVLRPLVRIERETYCCALSLTVFKEPKEFDIPLLGMVDGSDMKTPSESGHC